MTTAPDTLALLPHRPPFLFIDRVMSIDERAIVATRVFRPEEEFFRGHFPGRPIVPGVLLVEAMAQAMALLVLQQQPNQRVYLTGIDRARFRQPVLPGQEIEITVRIEGARLGVFRAVAEVKVGRVRVADATLSGFAGPLAS